jgi:hypothetical protein
LGRLGECGEAAPCLEDAANEEAAVVAAVAAAAVESSGGWLGAGRLGSVADRRIVPKELKPPPPPPPLRFGPYAPRGVAAR